MLKKLSFRKLSFILAVVVLLNITLVLPSHALSLSAPKNLKATAATKSIKLSWSKVTSAKYYQVYKYNGTKYVRVLNTTALTHTDKNLTGGTKYYYKVRAVNGKVVSPFSSIRKYTLPAPPKITSATAGMGSVNIRWGAVKSATKYKVYVATASGGTYAYKKSSSSSSCTVTGLKPYTTYYFKVSAVNVSGEGARSRYYTKKTLPLTYTGTGDKVITIKTLASYKRLKITHTGESNFIVWDYCGSYQDLLVNEIGNYGGTVLMQNPGTHTVEISADGNWKIQLYPLGGTSSLSFSGKGDYVTPAFTMPSNKTWKFTHDGEGNFIVWAYSSDNKDLVVNKIGSYSGSRVVDMPANKKTFFVITADGNWTIKK